MSYQEEPLTRKEKYQGKNHRPPKRKHPVLKFMFFLLIAMVLFIGLPFYQGMKKGQVSFNQNTSTENFQPSPSNDGSTNILLVGSDSRPNENTPSRSDTIMILHVGAKSGPLKLISIMRDSYVDIPGVGMNKINAAHAYGGAELLKETIEENFQLPIQAYAEVNFQTFEEVIGALFKKGVAVDVEKDISLDDVTLKKGSQTLNAHELLNYARFRMDEEGDFGRVRRQQQVINALAQEMKKPTNFIHLPKAIGTAYGYTQTNITIGKGMSLGLKSLIKSHFQLERLALPIADSWSYGNYPDAGSVIELNFPKNISALTEFLNK